MGGSRIRARFFGLRLQNDNHMKIVCITPVFPPIRAGMARAAFEIAAALGERAEVEVWTSVSPPAMRGEMERGFTLCELKSFGRIGYGSFHPIAGRVLRDADIVLLHYPFFGAMEPLALATLLPHRAKLVLWYHMDAVGAGVTKPVFAVHRALIAPWVLKRADAVVFASADYVASSPHADIILKKPHREIPFGGGSLFTPHRTPPYHGGDGGGGGKSCPPPNRFSPRVFLKNNPRMRT